METTLVQPRSTRLAPLSALTKLTLVALIGFAGLMVYAQLVLVGRFALDQTVIAGVMLLVAGLIATGRRWTPLLGALLSALVLLGNPKLVVHDLTHPESFPFFVSMVIAVSLGVLGLVSGISATVQNYRSHERRAPRVTLPAVTGLVMLAVGAILVGAIPREAGAGVSPELLASLPAITTRDFSFEQPKLTARVGETVALRFENTHSAPHSFDIDELNVHIPVGPGEQSLILFKPTAAGTYTFYCAVPGHRELGMEGTLIVEP